MSVQYSVFFCKKRNKNTREEQDSNPQSHSEYYAPFKTAVYKSGTGTRGRGHRDACVGTWDLGTRDEGLVDIKYGTRGRVGQGRGM